MSQGVQGHLQWDKVIQIIEGQGDRRKDESSWVDCRSWTAAAKANDSEWGREVEDKGKIRAKAKARIQAYNNIELECGKEKEQLQPKLLENN